MADRAACQRRVYRLALLLTGREEPAMEVVREVVDAKPNLNHIDSAHLDRLTVLRAREHPCSRLIIAGTDADFDRAAAALAGLTEQQREAWVFARLYRMPVREMSRAMDCSTTATARHLECADEHMTAQCGDTKRAAEPLLRTSMTVDLPALYYAQQLRRKIVRWLIAALIAMLTVVLVIAAIRVITDPEVSEHLPFFHSDQPK